MYIGINAAAGAIPLDANPNSRHQRDGFFPDVDFRNPRAGDRDAGVGPSGFLRAFLSAAARSDAVGVVMKGLDYAKAYAF